jgi:hypothetical protein
MFIVLRGDMKLLIAGLAVVTLGTIAQPADASVRAAKPFDFNGDGRRDMAISQPQSTVRGLKHAGKVTVVYGGGRAKRQVITRATRGIPGQPAKNGYFGEALASADFNRDGYADLAISNPAEQQEVDDTVIVYGSRHGLSSKVQRILRAGKLIATDFAHDGRADLVGQNNGNYWVAQNLGRGKPELSVTGFPAKRDEEGEIHPSDVFVADFNRDGRPDLVMVASPPFGAAFVQATIRFGRKRGLGSVHPIGLAFPARENGGLSQRPSRLPQDVNGDGYLDLITGVPRGATWQPVPPNDVDLSKLQVFYGGPTGLAAPVPYPN